MWLWVWMKWASVPVWAWSLGRFWLSVCLAGLGSPGGVWHYWQGSSTTGSFCLSKGHANLWHFLHAVDWKCGDPSHLVYLSLLRFLDDTGEGEMQPNQYTILKLVLIILGEIRDSITFVPEGLWTCQTISMFWIRIKIVICSVSHDWSCWDSKRRNWASEAVLFLIHSFFCVVIFSPFWTSPYFFVPLSHYCLLSGFRNLSCCRWQRPNLNKLKQKNICYMDFAVWTWSVWPHVCRGQCG